MILQGAPRDKAVLVLIAILVPTPLAAVAQDTPSDKSQYNLFNATPREQMRELSADRPDVTESPITVDAGHFQVEGSFIVYGRDNEGVDSESFSVFPVNLKAGLLNNVDLQLVLEPYVEIDSDDDNLSGFGDTLLRLKINLWGNDGGKTAFAFMPYIKFPTGDDEISNDETEGGLIFPFSIELPSDFSLGLMGEVDFVRNSENDGFDAEFLHSAVIGHPIGEDFAGYVEYIGIESSADEFDYTAALSTGVTYQINDDVQLDVGTVVGLTEDAEDFSVFTGFTVRL